MAENNSVILAAVQQPSQQITDTTHKLSQLITDTTDKLSQQITDMGTDVNNTLHELSQQITDMGTDLNNTKHELSQQITDMRTDITDVKQKVEDASKKMDKLDRKVGFLTKLLLQDRAEKMYGRNFAKHLLESQSDGENVVI